MPFAHEKPLTKPENIKALVFGAPGAGKSWFAGTWPKPIIVDADRGNAVWRNKEFRALYPNARIFYEEFGDPLGEDGVFESAKAFWNMLSWLNDHMKDYDTVVLDSLTSIGEMAMHVGLEVNKASGKSKTLNRASKGHNLLVPTMADYGAEMAAVEQLLDKVLELNKNVLVIAHERAEITDSGAVVRVEPLITGARLRSKIARWFDEVWYMEARGVKGRKTRTLQTDSDNRVKSAKSRYALPVEIENPTYEGIVKLMQ